MAQTITIVLSLLAFLSVIFIITIVHEFGHFALAKLCGVKVLRFSVGFGKPLFKILDRQKTEYALAPILLGGYVKLLDTREGGVEVSETEIKDAFDKKPVWQRLLIIIAGPGFNLACAVLMFWIVFTAGVIYVKPVVGSVLPHSPAAVAGIQNQDEIIAIDGQTTSHWSDVAMRLVSHYGDKGKLAITLRESREQKIRDVTVFLDLGAWRLNALSPQPLQSLGIVPYHPSVTNPDGTYAWLPTDLQKAQFSWYRAWYPALQQEIQFIDFNFIVLYKMLTGVISWQSLGGPLTIFKATVLAAGQGLIVYLNFIGLLSIGIAIINLLPIPGLDGAQIVYSVIELVWRKPVPVNVQILAFRIGLVLLLLLMFQATINDILRF